MNRPYYPPPKQCNLKSIPAAPLPAFGDNISVLAYTTFFSVLFFSVIGISCWMWWRCTVNIEKPTRYSTKRMTKKMGTTLSILDIKVAMPSIVIFREENDTKTWYDPFEFANLPAVQLGKGILGPLYKVVLNSGLIVTVRKARYELSKSADFNHWIRFFGRISDTALLPTLFSFWYGDEAFVVYEYMCLGSLDELLHGKEGIQFTSLNWGIRRLIALWASKAVAAIHAHVTKEGDGLVCGVIKSSNILIRTDFSACLAGYETPYLAPSSLIIRRNRSYVAPELLNAHSIAEFTQKSDVYSFGVLLLELVTGKTPTVSEAHRRVDFVKYVGLKRKREDLQRLYDTNMGNIVPDEMEKMVKIIDLCLGQNPSERPTMDMVVKMIQALQE